MIIETAIVKTLIFTGVFVTGESFAQPLPADVCWDAVAALERRDVVRADTVIGNVEVRTARCVDPDYEEIDT